MIAVAIDIGGTFTDLVGFDDKAGRFVDAKSLTTPHDLVQGIIDCLHKSGLTAGAIDELIHGSTIAINTLIERTGAKTALVVTDGTRDVYIIGRGNRPEAYNLLFHRHRPLVPRQLTREVGERVLASGAVETPLDRDSVEQVARALKAEGVDAVAVCFLHSYVNPDHERAAGEIIRAALPDAYLSLSHEILREYREFERTSTTVVNAYIGRRVGGYVRVLKSKLEASALPGNLSIMRSNGGVMTPEVAQERPVAMMESGPVGGIIASATDRREARLRQRHLVRHGRHHRQGEPDPRRRADHGAGLLCRRLCQRPPGHGADDRRRRNRCRRRLDRLARRDRRAQSRPAKRRRRSRPDLLSRRRHRADHHRRQCRARPARSQQLPRRHHEARRRRRAKRASRRRSPSRSA